MATLDMARSFAHDYIETPPEYLGCAPVYTLHFTLKEYQYIEQALLHIP